MQCKIFSDFSKLKKRQQKKKKQKKKRLYDVDEPKEVNDHNLALWYADEYDSNDVDIDQVMFMTKQTSIANLSAKDTIPLW